MLFELCQYTTRPGQRENWVRCMEDEVIPFQVSRAMVILGSFVGESDDSTYVWIRHFRDEAERERLRGRRSERHWRHVNGPRVPR